MLFVLLTMLLMTWVHLYLLECRHLEQRMYIVELAIMCKSDICDCLELPVDQSSGCSYARWVMCDSNSAIARLGIPQPQMIHYQSSRCEHHKN